jgi:hypothetical protein
MAGEHLLIVIEPDRAPGTLGDLRKRLAAVSDVPDETPLKEGYVASHLSDGIYVERPVDLGSLSFEELRVRAMNDNPEKSVAAWAEIKRRASWARAL